MTRKSAGPDARLSARRGGVRPHAVYAAAILAACFSSQAAAQTEVFNLSVGRFEAPSLSALTCDEVETIVARIDALGYREIGPVPPAGGEARRLYDYESAVIRMSNEQCRGVLR